MKRRTAHTDNYSVAALLVLICSERHVKPGSCQRNILLIFIEIHLNSLLLNIEAQKENLNLSIQQSFLIQEIICENSNSSVFKTLLVLDDENRENEH